MNICFTETPSRKTVKPSKTIFLNNTGGDVTFKFVTAPDLVLGAYTISNGLSAAIDCIRLGEKDYYSCHSQNFAIPGDSTAVLTLSNSVLTMAIST
ncbi:hypothetical protein SAMN05192549_110201 [Duganella sacchari]|uniref:Uncharacterized protein n=1 Tax=Duganella sacchari TaxID=551987 RepID=A0A1M7R4R5_9BURK|nr:hypothetical protein [Duganella sacchari]SHN40309.1 hypothetical protein SAMN05192549_110201 [Duganella sacchari]